MNGENFPTTPELFNEIAFEQKLHEQIALADIEAEPTGVFSKYSQALIVNLGGVPEVALNKVAHRAHRVGYVLMGKSFEDEQQITTSSFTTNDWDATKKQAVELVQNDPRLAALLPTLVPDLCVTAGAPNPEPYIAYTVAAVTILQIHQLEQAEFAATEAARQKAEKEAETNDFNKTFAAMLDKNLASLAAIDPFDVQAEIEDETLAAQRTQLAEAGAQAEHLSEAQWNTLDTPVTHKEANVDKVLKLLADIPTVLQTVRTSFSYGFRPQTTVDMIGRFGYEKVDISTVRICHEARALAFLLLDKQIYNDIAKVTDFQKGKSIPEWEWETYATECANLVATDPVLAGNLETCLSKLTPANDDERTLARQLACITLVQIQEYLDDIKWQQLKATIGDLPAEPSPEEPGNNVD